MKQPSKDAVEAILHRKRVNDKVDGALAVGKQHRQPAFDLELLDTVYRAYLHALDRAERREDDVTQVGDATAACVANLIVEFVIHTTPRGDAKLAYDTAQTVVNQLSGYVSQGVVLNYGEDKGRPN